MANKKSVYEQVVEDLYKGEKKEYKDYAEEWRRRGHYKEEFATYMSYVRYIMKQISEKDFKLKEVIEKAKQAWIAEEPIPEFLLLPSEKKLILKAEEQGRIKAGEVIRFKGYGREIRGYEYTNLPKDIDAFVVFSGHPGAASPAVYAWFKHFYRTGQAVKLIFLGLKDNQGNSDFSDTSLIYNVGSEQEMYRRYFKAMGASHEIGNECISEAYDISTEDNIIRLAEIKNRIWQDKDVKLAMFGYPVYQTRIATEFAWSFEQMEREGKCRGINFIIPSYKPSQNEYERYFSYDNLNGIAADIIIGNCTAHPYRVKGEARYDIGWGKYPDAYKKLLPLSLVYSYPNVAKELAGTDIRVATVLKVIRAIQHKTYGYEHPKKTDKQISYNVIEMRRRLVEEGLVSKELLREGYKLSKQEYLLRLQSFQREQKKTRKST